MVTHPPYAFDDEMNTRSIFHRLFKSLDNSSSYPIQIAIANNKIIEVVDKILINAVNKKTIIVIQADHGPWLNNQLDTKVELRLSILNAIYLPEKNDTSCLKTLTPVNTFRIIFNKYFGTKLDILENKSFYPYNESREYIQDVTREMKY